MADSSDAPLLQYIIVRKDLKNDRGKPWPKGAVIAQACHAAVAVCQEQQDDAQMQKYLCSANIDHMHKCVLGIDSEAEIIELSEKLKENEIPHKLWIEQPENIPTCLAVVPRLKSCVHKFFKTLKLL